MGQSIGIRLSSESHSLKLYHPSGQSHRIWVEVGQHKSGHSFTFLLHQLVKVLVDARRAGACL